MVHGHDILQDGYAVVASDGPGEYPIITESRAGNDGLGVIVVPGTVAYVTTGGEMLVNLNSFSIGCVHRSTVLLCPVNFFSILQILNIFYKLVLTLE